MARLEQGFVLDDRYRLDERVGEQGCAALWRGTDTILARTVTLMVLPSAAPETPRVLTAARRAARIRDSRIVQVFDTATFDDLTYVVTEWITGQTLTDLILESGPMHPDRAGALVGEAAEALTEAHRMAVSHLRLDPDNLVWTAAGGVKVTGVGIEAALAGTVSDDPAKTDAEGLGALLYVALTGRSPSGDHSVLPAAPTNGDDLPVSPRQVRAGVPPELDATTDRALSQRTRRGQPALSTPAAVAEALADFPDPTPLEFFADAPAAAAPSGGPATDPIPQVAAAPPVGMAMPAGGNQRERTTRRRRRALIAVPAGIAVVAVLAITGLRLGMSGITGGFPQAGDSSASSSPSASPSDKTPAGKQQIPVVDATDFDPMGDDTEHNENVRLSYDGTNRTTWYTDTYNSADFGNLKDGVGVIFDLGSAKKIGAVDVKLADAGSDVQLRSSDSEGSSPDDFDKVAGKSDAPTTLQLEPSGDKAARYWLVWFTKLPDTSDGNRAGLSEVTFRPAA